MKYVPLVPDDELEEGKKTVVSVGTQLIAPEGMRGCSGTSHVQSIDWQAETCASNACITGAEHQGGRHEEGGQDLRIQQ